jgi:MFS family permease
MSLGLRLHEAGFSGPIRRVLIHALFIGLALSISDILTPFYLVSLGYSTSEVGLFSTVARIAGMVSAIPLGRMVDRIGPQAALQIAISGSAVSWALLLIAPTLELMLAAQFLIGGLFLLIFSAATPLLAGLTTGEQRSQIYAVNEFMYVFVGLVGSAFGGALPGLLTQTFGLTAGSPLVYRLSLGSGVVLLLVSLLPVLSRLRGPEVRQSGPTATAAVQRSITVTRMIRLGLASLLIGLSSGTIIPFQGLFLREQFALSDATIGLIVSATSLSAGIGALGGATLVRRIGLKRGAAVLRMLVAPAILLLIVPQLSLVVLGFIIRAGFISASVPQGDAFVMSQAPAHQRGRVVSITSLMWSGGWAISSLLAGYAAPIFGYGPQFAIALVLALASGLAVWTLREHTETQGAHV